MQRRPGSYNRIHHNLPYRCRVLLWRRGHADDDDLERVYLHLVCNWIDSILQLWCSGTELKDFESNTSSDGMTVHATCFYLASINYCRPFHCSSRLERWSFLMFQYIWYWKEETMSGNILLANNRIHSWNPRVRCHPQIFLARRIEGNKL